MKNVTFDGQNYEVVGDDKTITIIQDDRTIEELQFDHNLEQVFSFAGFEHDYFSLMAHALEDRLEVAVWRYAVSGN